MTKENFLKRTSLGVVALTSVAVLAACGNSQSSSSNKEINWAIPTEINTLDVSKNTDTYSSIALGNTGSNLLRVDEDGKLQPDLATKVDVSKDGLTYTATLRKGIKWSDGSAIKAEDFVYSWQRILDPKTASEYAFLGLASNVENAEEINSGKITDLNQLGVKAEGNKVIFKLTKPSPQMEYFLSFNSFLPQKKSFVEKAGKKYGTNADNQIYSGPYVLKGWNGTNNKFTFVKNKNYWDAKNVKTDKVNIQVVKKPETAVQMYKSGKLDAANISNTPAMYKANKNSKDLVDVLEATSVYFQYNQTGKVKALSNTKIRQALNLATNREAFVKTVVPTGSRAATGLAPYGLAKVNGKDLSTMVAPGYKYDAAEAKRLFQEGLKEIGETSVKLTITSDADSPTAKSSLDYIKGAWEKTLPGLTIEEKFVPFKQRLQDQTNANFDIVLSLWGGDYPEGSTFYGLFVTGNSQNNGKFSNATYDAQYQEAITTNALNPEKAAENYKAAEKALYDEANINPLYFRSTKSLQNPKLVGIVRNTTGLSVDFTHAYKK